MSAVAVPLNPGPAPRDAFRHEALFYSGREEFVERATAFIREGLDAGEPVLVLVVAPKIELLREKLGARADEVLWGDMGEIGRNPGRIISVWREFVSRQAVGGGRVRGIGEPIWAGRTEEELVESQRHESLINLAFTGAEAWVLCPYDVAALEPAVVDEAFRSHPFVSSGGVDGYSETYRDLSEVDRPFDHPLAEPEPSHEGMVLTVETLSEMRHLVTYRAAAFGLSATRAEDLVLAVNEVATNSLRHGKGVPRLRVWATADALICDVTDEGGIDAPLAGRQRPSAGQDSGYGLWMANQLCDLVQLRSFTTGSVVRLRMNRR
jgi:anti-sigma regulatory factor (Ser/Thr protein kinase)